MTNKIPCRKAFADTLLGLARQDSDIVVLTTDARGSAALEAVAKELPAQFIELGIAEQNAVGVAAGLAACGKKPFLCGPASFLSARSLEQVKVDVGYSRTNVKIVGVSGGVSYGALGMSHHALHDIAVMRALPGLSVVLPCDVRQTRLVCEYLAGHVGGVYVRMGRNPVPDVYAEGEAAFRFGKANLLMDGSDVTIVGTGETVRHALDAGRLLNERGIGARVLDMAALKPLDAEAIVEAAERTGRIVTVEEHSVCGGLGSAVAEVVVQRRPVPMRIIGFPDEEVVTGDAPDLFEHYGLTGRHIADRAMELLEL
jgi:transketolase